MSKLTVEAVRALFGSCLFDQMPDPLPDDTVLAWGAVLLGGFVPEKLEAAKPRILELLQELPPTFTNPDHGDSFLNMCVDKHGVRWGEHLDADSLLVLGLAGGFVQMASRALWPMFEGGMPVLRVQHVGGLSGSTTYGALRHMAEDTTRSERYRKAAVAFLAFLAEVTAGMRGNAGDLPAAVEYDC